MASLSASNESPISDINTTPLIDVLLVLLIMFIITIPLQTHAVKVDMPTRPPTRPIDPVSNKIVISEAGLTLWNGAPIGKQDLAAQLSAVGAMKEQPELQLQPEPRARYDLVDEVLAMTKRAHVTRLGFVGNEQYRQF